MRESPHPAIVLLGPTGSGKTPLGQLLEQRGWNGRRCVHFDFGENLRMVVRRDEPDAILSREDIDFLKGVLDRGDLLEDSHFPIAERILLDFLTRRRVDDRTVVGLNGLPRHAGQAAAVGNMLAVEAVICLRCSAETAVRRIRLNSGGDRTGRVDDDLPAVRRKLTSFEERTAPLVQWYRQRGAQILPVEVTAEMTPETMWELVQRPDGS